MRMSADEHYLEGMDHFGEDRIDEAIAAFKRAVEAEPNHADSLHALAMCYYHRRDFDQAIGWGERYRAADPDSPLPYTSLSMFFQAKGMIAEAEEMGAMAQRIAAGQKES
jgi:tetratricopeptide (TPR) repeat protein